jgi:hypothetical protein
VQDRDLPEADRNRETGSVSAGPVEAASRQKTSRIAQRWLSRIAGALISVCMLFGLVFGGLFALLSRGPLDIPFLSERVSVALEKQIGNGVDADVGRTLLERTANGIALHVQDVVIKDQNGLTILRSPDAIIAFDPIRLLTLSLVPRRVELKGISLRISIGTDGAVAFSAVDDTAGASTNAEKTAEKTRVSQGLAALALLARRGSVGELTAMSIEEATLLIDDQRVGRQIRFDQLSMQFDSPESGLAVAKGSVSRSGLAIPFSVRIKTIAENYGFTLETSNVNDEVIASAIGLSELPLSSNGTLSGQMQIVADPEGKVLEAEAIVKLKDGSVVVKGMGEKPFLVSEATLQTRWNGGLTQIESAALSIKGDEYTISVAGNVSLPTASDPWFRFKGVGKDWSLVGLTPADPAILVDTVTMAVSVKNDGRQILLDSMQIKGVQTDISLNGRFQRKDDGPVLEARAILGAMPVRNAIRWWPRFLAPQTRTFFANSVLQGRLTRLDFSMALPSWKLDGSAPDRAMPADALKLEAAVEGVTAQIAPGLPPLVGVAGSGRMNARQADGVASSAKIELKNNRSIPLSEGSFTLTGLDSHDPGGSFGFRAQTPLDHVVELLKTPALKDALKTGVDANSLKGQFDGRGKITIPLGVALTAKNILAEFQGKMTSVSLENAIGKDKLENATLSLNSDATGFEIKGEGRWLNIPVGIALERDTTEESSSAVLSFALDDAGLKRFGISLGQPVSAPVPIKIKTLREQGEGLKANIEADLTRISFDGLIPGFRKPSGRPAKLTFDATEKPGGYTLQNISLESGSSTFKGNAEVNNGTVTSARFSVFRLSPGDNTRLDYDRIATGRRIIIRGNNFDARPFLKQASPAGENKRSAAPSSAVVEDMEIDIKTTLLSGFGGEVITNPELQAVRRGEILRQFNLVGKLNGKKIQVTGKSNGEASTPLIVSVDDAGAFLRYIDVYSRMIGGQLDGQISAASRRATGVFSARNFSLRDEPAIRRLVQQAPVATSPQDDPARRIASNDTRFNRMRLAFALDGAKTTISEAVISGSEIGLTFNGLVDYERDRISISGTFVPAYGLNNALSRIPVLGNLLTGEKNEGVLALTFGVSGRASAPTVSINPLSAITPGIFRKIFEFRNETTGSSAAPLGGGAAAPNN